MMLHVLHKLLKFVKNLIKDNILVIEMRSYKQFGDGY